MPPLKKMSSKARGKHPRRTRRHKTDNGMRRFSMHAFDERDASRLAKLTAERADFPAFSLVGPANVAQLDPETVAKRYLAQALQSRTVPSFTVPKPDNITSEFRSLGTETVPLTRTTIVKFRQTLGQIPVYGSLVTVELDGANNLVSLSSSLGEPKGVSSVARIAPANAVKAVEKYPGFKKQLANVVPQLMYYFDKAASKWRLVFFFEDVPVTPKRGDKVKPVPEVRPAPEAKPVPEYMDYVVDAHTGKVVAEVPRTPNMASTVEQAQDGLNQARPIRVEIAGAKKILQDTSVNVQTFDFEFHDPSVNRDQLPGKAIDRPPNPWAPSAVSAHANTVEVAEFLRNVLGRNNIDNKGGAINGSINCVVAAETKVAKEWLNASWNGDQMVYGQRQDGTSLSVNLDVVGHEIFHGVTRATARLEYAFESGALNESYSDIFGVIIANFHKRNTLKWNWQLAAGMSLDGKALRNFRDPALHKQPTHMRDYVQVLLKDDWGGVHTNSGIHNKAAYNFLTSIDSAGNLVFKPKEVAAIFYVALTQFLTRTSKFSDSRRAVILSARSFFRKLPRTQLAVKLDAIEKSFSAVGISQ